MRIKYELFRDALIEGILQNVNSYDELELLDQLNIDINEIPDIKARMALAEIQEIVKDDEISDFDALEEIVCIFETYGIDAGSRHNF